LQFEWEWVRWVTVKGQQQKKRKHMAHRIYQFDKQQGRVMGWHGKTEIKSVLTLDDNWLNDWDLVAVPFEKRGKPTRWVGLECSDNPEIEIGAPYNPETFKPVTNKDFLQLIRDSIGGTQHKIVSVGSVRNRGRVFVSIELVGMEAFQAAGRKFSAFLNFGNGHDKSSVLWANTSNTCTVCDNTFTMNLFSVENKADKNSDSDDLVISQRHTKNVTLKLPAIADLIDRAIGVQGEFKLQFENLGKISVETEEVTHLFAGFVGRKIAVSDRKLGLSTRSKNTVGRLSELHARGRGNQGETLADAVSAVTDYYTHESGGKNRDPQRQLVSSDFGGSASKSKSEFWTIVNNLDLREQAMEVGEELLVNTK
jgi:hypothetical protein